MSNIFSFYCVASACCYLLFGIFCLIKNRTRRINQLWSLSSLMIAIWSFGLGMVVSADSLQNAQTWLVIHYLGAILIPPTFLHYTFELTEASVRTKKQLFFWYPIFLSFLFLNFFKQDLIVRVSSQKPFFHYYTDVAPLYYVYTVAFFLCIAEAFMVQIRALLRKDIGQMRRLQLVYMFAATSFGFLGGATAFFPVFGWPIFPWGMYFVILYPLLMTYAIVRHRLLDIQLAVTRTGIFILIYCFIVGIPAFLIFQMRGLLERQLGVNWWLLPAGAFSLLSFIGPFIYMTIQHRAEAVLMKEQRAYQQTLLQASKGMTLIKDLDKLLRLIVRILTKTIRITHARIFLWDGESKQFICKASHGDHHKQGSDVISETASLIHHVKETKEPLVLEEIKAQSSASPKLFDEAIREMERLDAAVVVPSFVQDRLLGFVALGDKKSKRLYTESDLDTLATLANQAALAIENCIFLTNFEQQQTHFFQTAKMADLGTMASGIGHQVNNRFNLTKVGAEVMIMSSLPRLRKYMKELNVESEGVEGVLTSMEKLLKSINKNCAHGGEIVSRLLDFSRLSEGFKPVDVKEAIDSCLRLWECKHDLTIIDFKLDVADNLPKVHGNLSEIEEILFNLLDNAFDAFAMKEEALTLGKLEKTAAVPKGAVWLSVKEATIKDKRYVEFIIADNGLGMTTESKKQVFIPFFTTKGANKGTGLGLYIIRRMVDAHHGEILLESEYGKGTTFHILIPVSNGQEDGKNPVR